MSSDIRYAARLLRRNPLFATTAVLSIAIGIGANTTIFTVANALLFRAPSGVAAPDRLVDIGRSQDGEGFDNNSYPNYLDVRARATTLEGVYAYRFGATPVSLGGTAGGEGAERIYAHLVSANTFDVLGTRPRLGRLFDAEDDRHGAADIAVLSHAFWERRFGASPDVLGRSLTLNGRPFTVVGVAPAGFRGTSVLAYDVFLPLAATGELDPARVGLLTERRPVWLMMGGRLKPGVSIRQAREELTAIGRALEREYPDANRGRGLRVLPLSPLPGNEAPVRAFLGVLAGIVALVLAVACANVAGVLLARASARRREIAVRLAIGAGRRRLVRQLLVESGLLFVLGGAAGLALARGMTTLLRSLLPALPLPVDVSLPLDARAVAFTLVISLLAAVLAGLAPALHATRAEVASDLAGGAAGRPDRHRLRAAFVIGQIAFSLVLVVGAGLFVRALRKAAAVDPGFDPRGVELASLDLTLGRYTEATGPAFASELLQRVRAVPGVQAAALCAVVPLGGEGLGLGGLEVPGVEPPAGRKLFDADWNVVSPGFFAALRTPLVRGRDFTVADRQDAPGVVIVNETAARQWWPGEDPVGKTLRQQNPRPDDPDAMRTLTVVGVARDAKYRSLGEAPRRFVYVPLAQQYLPRTTIVARAAQGRRLAAELRAAVAALDPNLPVVAVKTLDEHAALGLVPQRLAASISGSLGLVGLLLAAIGIYGVTASLVASRTREIGVRVALGARRADVVGMVLKQGMGLTGAGLAIGLVLAAAGSRLVASLLFGVRPADPAAFAGAVALFAAVSLAACLVPARRAVSVDAASALRHE